MKKIIFVSFLLIAFLPAVSFAYSVTLYDFTGSDAEVQIDITGDGTTEVEFNVQVVNPLFADIRGVFFNFETFPDDVWVIPGGDWTSSSFIDNGAHLGGGADITPAGPFDAAIEIGDPGIGGGDDFYSTMFTIASSSNLFLGDTFGARLTSVGDFANNREGSSKLLGVGGDTPSNPVPEPSTMLLLGTGLAGLAGMGRKKITKN